MAPLSLSTQKQQLRSRFSQQRAALAGSKSQNQAHARLCTKLASWITELAESKGLDQVFAYYPHGHEPDLRSLLELLSPKPLTSRLSLSRRLSFALPVCLSEGQMDFYEWRQGSELQLGRFGIWEPVTSGPKAAQAGAKLLEASARTLILVPALALDRRGMRLGYGKGFYDRYLAKYPSAYRMGVVWEEFLLGDPLPAESWDEGLAYAATENGIVSLAALQ